MEIPLVDLKAQYGDIGSDILSSIESVIRRTQFILGEEVGLFEDEFAHYCGADHCVGVGSGTDALHLVLRALGIGPGDEVIVPANSFIATAFAVSYLGATPVFVDVSPDDFNMDVRYIEEAITKRTKAVVPVHLYGQPADMDAILDVANRRGLRVVEDACQAHGAMISDKRVGTFGVAGCFSFYPGKNLGAYGDGGAVVTDDPALAEQIRSLRNYGQSRKYLHESLGFNSRLDALQAAILRVKLSRLDDWNEKRRSAARVYARLLSSREVVLPKEKTGVRHVYHLFVVRHSDRDRLISSMTQRGIGCGIHYPIPLPRQKQYLDARTVPQDVPISSELAGKILSLPLYPEITEEQIERVATAIAEYDREKRMVAAAVVKEDSLRRLS
jgi:dTDP-4-amino-4,6-dideoxygalactose transaminase